MAEKQHKVLIAHKRVPLTKILNGRSIPEAIAELKAFRAQFAEWEVLHRAETSLAFNQNGCTVYLYRPENKKETDARLEEERLAREAKLERARKKEEREKIKAQKAAHAAAIAEEKQRHADLETIKMLSRKLGLSPKDLADI